MVSNSSINIYAMASADESEEGEYSRGSGADAGRRPLHVSKRDVDETPTVTYSPQNPRTPQGISSKSQHRRSYQETVPALPAIPARFLRTGRPASISGLPTTPTSPRFYDRLRRDVSRGADITPEAAPRVERREPSVARPSTSHGRAQSRDYRRTSWYIEDGVEDAQDAREERERSAIPPPLSARLRSRSTAATGARELSHKRERAQHATGTEDMARRSKPREEDLFLELARDSEERDARPPSRGGDRTTSRLSQLGNRRSLPPEGGLASASDRRPKSSGNVFPRPSSRLGGFPSDLQRHVDRYKQSPGQVAGAADDVVSTSGRSFSMSGRPNRFANVPENVPTSRLRERLQSPEMPSFGRGRPSYGAPAPKDRQAQESSTARDSQDESPAGSSEPKPDSASVESTTDTVWDELDDLKTRIKKLEVTGKPSPTPGAPVSGDSSDRPRTATTAPTTIESSPKHERKPEAEVKAAPTEPGIGGPNAANIHPLLHAALKKAKSLLNGPLYRSLEATAVDALQLAAMTGSAGPQGTTFSAASIINGVTVSDRHVRRKADTMCRNLTDLTLALCEGKHEAPSVTASPVILEPLKKTPSIRYSRSSLGRDISPSAAGERPMSRLDARRTSILGLPPTGATSRRSSAEDVSTSEQEYTPSHTQPTLRRASSRLLSSRMRRYDDASGDEDPTIRPPSRAMTEVSSNLRNRVNAQRERDSPGQQESPSLRSGLATRRANAGAFESNREQSRVLSLNSDVGRRRWAKESTPPVMEEEMNDDGEYQPSSQPRRRVTSLSQFSTRRMAAEPPSRATSLSQRRQAVAE
ncbi:hypothetical protein LTR17_022015 [Elasticomyces elasticus]|nr:hypothetical protein LTR17_022015 [Elasticomyces elasticus]